MVSGGLNPHYSLSIQKAVRPLWCFWPCKKLTRFVDIISGFHFKSGVSEVSSERSSLQLLPISKGLERKMWTFSPTWRLKHLDSKSAMVQKSFDTFWAVLFFTV